MLKIDQSTYGPEDFTKKIYVKSAYAAGTILEIKDVDNGYSEVKVLEDLGTTTAKFMDRDSGKKYSKTVREALVEVQLFSTIFHFDGEAPKVGDVEVVAIAGIEWLAEVNYVSTTCGYVSAVCHRA